MYADNTRVQRCLIGILTKKSKKHLSNKMPYVPILNFVPSRYVFTRWSETNRLTFFINNGDQFYLLFEELYVLLLCCLCSNGTRN